jgi:hypothetical protein
MILGPPVWVTEHAAIFWAQSQVRVAFPRDLREAVCWLDKLHLHEIPHLTLAGAIACFRKHQIPAVAGCENRPLAGCFAGYRDRAVIGVDSTLHPTEFRFTLAHEIAHYLRDYLVPRQRLVHKLGAQSLEVLDGKRPATLNEQFAAIFRGVTLECHTHFLERDRWGQATTEESRSAEDAADWLAFELLAPCESLFDGQHTTPETLSAVLISKYGFSVHQAAKYVTILLA